MSVRRTPTEMHETMTWLDGCRVFACITNPERNNSLKARSEMSPASMNDMVEVSLGCTRTRWQLSRSPQVIAGTCESLPSNLGPIATPFSKNWHLNCLATYAFGKYNTPPLYLIKATLSTKYAHMHQPNLSDFPSYPFHFERLSATSTNLVS